jgi:hypothetical protein
MTCYYCEKEGEEFWELTGKEICRDCKQKVVLLLQDKQFLEIFLFTDNSTQAIINPEKMAKKF